MPSDPLDLIWRTADIDSPAFGNDEAISWEPDVARSLVDLGVLRPGKTASHVICDECGEQHKACSVKYPDGTTRLFVHCPENGRSEVKREQLLQWAVSFEAMAKAVASGLDLSGQVEDVIPGRLWSLGKTTIGGRSRDVFLARGSTWIDAPGVFGACERLNASRGALVLVPGEMPPQDAWTGDPPDVVPLKLVARLEDARLTFDRDHLEGLLTGDRRKAPIKAQKTFPTPPRTRWDEVMVWVTDSTISIEAKRRSRDFSFQAAGFEEKRKRGVPDGIWSLLKVFAMRGGEIPYDGTGLEHSVRMNVKQYVSELRKRLRALIPGIDGNPIPHVKVDRCYRMSFKIASRENLTFPVPDGTQWPNVTITLARPDAIRVSVPTTERFAASSYVEEAGGDVHEWDAAEREAEREREYDLRMLGLADENGRPDARGTALIEVLRGNGTASRRADDKAMEDLCGVLSKLMAGIEGSPFDFAPSSKKWIARFQASAD